MTSFLYAFLGAASGLLVGAAIAMAISSGSPSPPVPPRPQSMYVIQDNTCGWTTASSRHALDACAP